MNGKPKCNQRTRRSRHGRKFLQLNFLPTHPYYFFSFVVTTSITTDVTNGRSGYSVCESSEYFCKITFEIFLFCSKEISENTTIKFSLRSFTGRTLFILETSYGNMDKTRNHNKNKT